MTSFATNKPVSAYRPGDEIPSQVVTAHNASNVSENKIHEDDTAKRYGFRGGLVPGVTVFAYLAAPLAAAFGEQWLTNGRATVSLVQPLYDGERATSRGQVTETEASESGGACLLDVWTENVAGQRCGTGSAAVSERGFAPVAVPAFVHAEAPAPPARDERPGLTLAEAPVGSVLPRLIKATSIEDARGYASGVFDANPLFHEGSSWGQPLMHPGWLLSECNYIFTQAFYFSPWIHTRSEIQYLGPALAGQTFTFHGQLAETYERRGHDYAVLELFCTDSEGRSVMQVRHTAIFRVQPRAVSSRNAYSGPADFLIPDGTSVPAACEAQFRQGRWTGTISLLETERRVERGDVCQLSLHEEKLRVIITEQVGSKRFTFIALIKPDPFESL